MKLGVCIQAFYPLGRGLDAFEQALGQAAALGFESIELPVDARSPFIDLEDAIAGGHVRIARAVRAAGLTISALSNHQEGQLLLGPHGRDTDPMFAGSAEHKVRFAHDRMVRTADLAQRLEVDIVCGFTGCEDYSRWFPWPVEDAYDQMCAPFRAALLPLLDQYATRGIRFAHECHPRQFAYNLETAQLALATVDQHPAFGFNFDPANLLLAGMDPVVFVAELGSRIVHAHAKDGELVSHHAGRSGLLAHGAPHRRDRGFRFRIPGWGDLSWRRLISELQLAGYRGVLSVEHEDPTMSPREGLVQAVRHLAPLILRDPAPTERWW
ncbi:MAG: sugar phosphate isomerase/epimerase family protein [Kofleriaceae bacterium]